MKKRPLILVTPSTQPAGAEMADHSISISSRYFQAVLDHGGLPLGLPLTTDHEVIAEAVRQCHGVMITGGDDIHPALYWPDVPRSLLRKCTCAEIERDLMELSVIEEVIRQRRPVLAICRGHQLFNAALGGSLIVDIPSQRPGALRHSRQDKRCDKVHPVKLKRGSLLARLTRQRQLDVNSTHHQTIDRLAEALVATAVAGDGLIEATEFRAADRGMLPWFASVQFHPERLYDRFPEHRPLFRDFVRACRQQQRVELEAA